MRQKDSPEGGQSEVNKAVPKWRQTGAIQEKEADLMDEENNTKRENTD